MASSSSLVPAGSFLNTYTSSMMETFVANQLQPTVSSNASVTNVVDSLVRFLQHNTGYSVRGVIKGGSYGKGTQVRNLADLDVVVFLNDFSNMSDFTLKLNGVITNLESKLQAWRPDDVNINRHSKHAVKVTLEGALEDGTDLEIDILPSYDNLGRSSLGAVYEAMKNESAQSREFYSASLAQLQINFVSKQAANVKNLIRLVKYWNKTHLNARPKKLQGVPYPTSYILELITIHAWEQAGRPNSFSYAKGLRAVLELLSTPYSINISWYQNYNNNYGVDTSRPFVLDPANPFNNVASRFKNSWDDVSAVARASLDTQALRGLDTSRW